MRNKHPGTCFRCGESVGVGEGHFQKVTSIDRKKWPDIRGQWQVQHAGCAIKYRGTDVHYRFAPEVTEKESTA